jgi:hypothetical protein
MGANSKGRTIVVKGVLDSYQKDGKTQYKIGKAKLQSEAVTHNTEQGEQKPSYSGKSPDDKAQICRCNALTAAVTLLADAEWAEGVDMVSTVLVMAKRFSQWTLTGEEKQSEPEPELPF